MTRATRPDPPDCHAARSSSGDTPVHPDLDHLAGTWSAAEARRFADRIKAFEAVDRALWESGDPV